MAKTLALTIGVGIAAGACSSNSVKPEARRFDLVSDGPAGARKATAAYVPSEARKHAKRVASEHDMAAVEVPNRTPDMLPETAGGVSISQRGAVTIVWSDKAQKGEMEFVTVPQGATEMKAFDDLYGVCERGASGPARPSMVNRTVSVGAEGATGCFTEYPRFGMSLLWSSGGQRFILRDNRTGRSLDEMLAVAQSPRVNLLAK